MSVAIKGIEAVLNRFARLTRAADNLEKPTEKAGKYMLSSIARNFDAQGRPQKWQGLAPSTLKSKKSGRILVESGNLKKSVTDSAETSRIGFSIATTLPYARRQQFGYPGGSGRGRSKTPARPFLLFQAEDEDAILTIFNRHFEQAL